MSRLSLASLSLPQLPWAIRQREREGPSTHTCLHLARLHGGITLLPLLPLSSVTLTLI